MLLSVFGGLRSVLVEADLTNVGIMVDFKLLTLAERASDDFVGVVTTLGRLGAGDLIGDVVVLVISIYVPLEPGLASEVSSSKARLARLPGAVFSRRSVLPL